MNANVKAIDEFWRELKIHAVELSKIPDAEHPLYASMSGDPNNKPSIADR